MNPERRQVRSFFGCKAAWQRRLLVDPQLSPQAKVLGGVLMHYFDENGRAWPAQTTLAADLNVDVRTIRRVTRELREHGYISVRGEGGRGRANIYTPIFTSADEGGAPAPRTQTGESRPNLSSVAGERRTAMSGQRAETRTDRVGKADTAVRPLPYDSKFPPSPHDPNRSPATRRSGGAGRLFEPSAIRSALVRRIGEAATRSYLDPAAWNPVDRVVICSGQTAATRLIERAGGLLNELGIRVTCEQGMRSELASNVISLPHARLSPTRLPALSDQDPQHGEQPPCARP